MSSTVVPVFSWLLLILGLSYLFQADIWIRLSRDALANDYKYYTLYLLLLIFGLVVVTEHNKWTMDWNIAITIFGWSMVIKSAIFLITPQLMRPLRKLLEKAFIRNWIRIAGLVLTILGAILVYNNVFNGSTGV
ncbi:MAG: hypothetical protein PVG45_12060 [Gammaproteobacteria bacterium]